MTAAPASSTFCPVKKLNQAVKAYLVQTPWREVVQDQTEAVLESLKGNKTQTAVRLGVSRRTVYNRLGKAK